MRSRLVAGSGDVYNAEAVEKTIEEMTIENEYKALSDELAALQSLSSSPAKQWRQVGKDLEAVRKWMAEQQLAAAS